MLVFLCPKAPKSHKWISATNRNINYPRRKDKHHGRAIDPHCTNGTVAVLLSLLPIHAANMSVMTSNNQVTGELPYLPDHKLLTFCWRPFQCIAHSTSAAIDNWFYPDLNLLVVFLSDWDLDLWQSRVEQHSCTVYSCMNNNNISGQKIHCACNTSVYQPIFTRYCSLFAHNISLTETLGEATYSSSWTFDTLCAILPSLIYLFLFLIHWPSPTPFQPVSLTYM